MNQRFRTVGLVGKHEDPRVGDSMIALARHLAANGVSVLLPEHAALDELPAEIRFLPEAQIPADADLIVAVGGDGTILHATRLVAGLDVPVLGINRGRLGFLADVSPDTMLERLDEVLAGNYIRESRLMLQADIVAAGATPNAVALNDVVVQKLETGRMLDFETWIGGCYVNTHGGDGLVIATATGSTAYALSGGGPIIHPELDAIVLVPICPHTLSDRPIVVRAECEIEVRLVERPETRAHVVCDGQILGELTAEGRLRVRRAERPVTLLHTPDHDYYRILRSKLHWGRGGQVTDRR
ncbi:MAG: NAD(+) kinase [Gammaproteobacteria bacterium]